MSEGWTQIMQNPRGFVLKKFMLQVIDNKVANYDDLLTRLGTILITDNDLQMFGDMINQVLMVGYKKAVDDYKEQLDKMGIQTHFLTKN